MVRARRAAMTRTVPHSADSAAAFRDSPERDLVSLKGYTHPYSRTMRSAAPAALRHCHVDELEALACAVGRLAPDYRDPERFHLDRSEIVADLRRLARTWKAA